MVILISGVTGYIGANLSKALADKGFDVYGLARQSSSHEYVKNVNPKIKILEFTRYEELNDVVSKVKPSIMVHLATKFSVENDSEIFRDLLSSNLEFGLYLADVCVQNNVGAFINTNSSWQFNEAGEVHPTNLYAASKSAFDSLLSHYAANEQIRVMNLVLYDVYGAMDPRGKLISSLPELAAKGQELLLSGGEQKLSLVYIDDVVQAYVNCCLGMFENEVKSIMPRYAVKADDEITLRDAVALFNKHSPTELDCIFGARPYRKNEVMKPCGGIITLPGWKQTITFENGIKLMLGSSQYASELMKSS